MEAGGKLPSEEAWCLFSPNLSWPCISLGKFLNSWYLALILSPLSCQKGDMDGRSQPFPALTSVTCDQGRPGNQNVEASRIFSKQNNWNFQSNRKKKVTTRSSWSQIL